MSKFRPGVRLTLNEVRKRLKDINPNIKITDEIYINARTKMKCECLVDGNVWYATWDNLKNKKGCPECRDNSFRKGHNNFIKEMSQINNDVKIVSKYINMKSMMNCICKIDNTNFTVRADSLIAGYGCPTCASKKRSKSHGAFVNEINKINDYIKIISTYKNKRTKVKCFCSKCGHEWSTLPSSLLGGSNCPNCSVPMSNGEIIVEEYLKNKGIEYNKEHTFNGCKNDIALRFDFYLPSKNICIEYDGEQHFKPIEYFGGEDKFKKVKENDHIKNEFCKNNNIKLIRIPYTVKDIDKFIHNN